MGKPCCMKKKLYRAEGSKTIGILLFPMCSQCVPIKFSQCTYQVPNGSQALPTCYLCSQCVLQHVPNSTSLCSLCFAQLGTYITQHNIKTYTFLCLCLEWIQYQEVSKVSELFFCDGPIKSRLIAKTRGVSHWWVLPFLILPFTLKSIVRQKKNYGNSNISP